MNSRNTALESHVQSLENPKDFPETLTVEDFAKLFGIPSQEMPKECLDFIQKCDFRYRSLEGKERDETILEVVQKLYSEQWSTAGKEGKGRWDKGWGENLQNFLEQKNDLNQLIPKYVRPNQPVRLYQDYVIPYDKEFEWNWYGVFRLFLFQKYLKDAQSIFEFGCGSGHNLAVLAQLFPGKQIHGLDWAAPSKEIADTMAKTYHWKIKGHVFDFFNPEDHLEMDHQSALLTVGALEQTGLNYESFLQFILKKAPQICVHSEPVIEFYDPRNLVDYLGVKFHQKRKYWEGFPQRLRQLESEGKVEILKMHRGYFGSLFLDGYSQIVWRVKS